MLSQIIYAERAKKDLDELKDDKNKKGMLKTVCKAIKFLGENPRHPDLRVHQYHSMPQVCTGKKIWEAYSQEKTPVAYRIFWCYGPSEYEITIVAVTGHP
jgi:hypothetical protein